MTCEHRDFAARVTVNRIEDRGAFDCAMVVNCRACGLPFVFMGVDAGMSFARPMCSPDAREIRLPIRPDTRPQLATNLVIEIPPREA